MDWEFESVSSVEKDDAKFIRDTMEAKIKAESGQYGDSARILWELLAQLRREKRQKWECITMVHLGKVYRTLRWKIAIQLLEDAIELSDSLDFHKAKAMALIELGEIRCQWGQFKESLGLFDKAMSLIDQDDKKKRRTVLLNIVVAHEGMGDLKICRQLLNEVIEIDKDIACDEIEEDIAHLKRLMDSCEQK